MIVEVAVVVAAVAAVSLLGVQVAKWVERRAPELSAPSIEQKLEALGGDPAAASATDAAYRADEPATLFEVAQLQLEKQRATTVTDVRMLDAVEKAKRAPDPNATVVAFRKERDGVYDVDGDYVLSDGRIVRQEFMKMYWRATGEKLSREDLPIAKRIHADWDRQAKEKRLAEWKEKP